MVQRYFEDFAVGDVLPLGSHRVTRAEIIAFAAEFDPQPFHLDERQGSGTMGTDSMVDGLIASGWHVAGLFMRMLCDGFLLESSSLGSPGIETLKWRKPVRAGDTLTGKATVIEVRRSKSRPEMGIVRFRSEVENQAGETVMWLENPILFGCREVA